MTDRLPDPRPSDDENRPSAPRARVVDGRERVALGGRLTGDVRPTLDERPTFEGRLVNDEGPTLDRRGEIDGRLTRFVGRAVIDVGVLRTPLDGEERGAVARARPTDGRDVPRDTELRAFDRPKPARDGARVTRDGRERGRLARTRLAPLRDLLRAEGPRVPFRLGGPAEESATPANNITAAGPPSYIR